MHTSQFRGRVFRMLLLASANGWSVSPCLAQDIHGVGSPFVAPLFYKWLGIYHRPTSPQITYRAIGSGGGIRALKDGKIEDETIDFAVTDVPLSDAELKAMPDKVEHLPLAANTVVVAYDLPTLTKPLRLSGEVLVEIYFGEITRWNDRRIKVLNPGVNLPALTIYCFHRSDGSGATHIFTRYLSAVSSKWARQVGYGKLVDWPAGLGAKGGSGIGDVKATPGTIMYVEWPYAQQNHLQMAAIRNRYGVFISPGPNATTAAIANSTTILRRDIRTPIVNARGAKSYPICGLSYLLLYIKQKDQRKKQEILRFFRWSMSSGQTYVRPLEYAPLPPALLEMSRSTLLKIK